MEFSVSESEITRRKKAFVTFLASLFAGLLLSSLILKYPITPAGYLIIAVFFSFTGLLTFTFLNSTSKTKIFIDEEKIERTNGKKSESFLLADISRIKTKLRKNGKIREIYLWFGNDKKLFITAFEENFESIKDIISKKIEPEIPNRETREIIDFDHPLFYLILGLPVSFVGVLAVKLAQSLDYSGAKILLLIISIYILTLGAYFCIAKPLSSRYGGGKKTSDCILGFFLIFIAIIMLVWI
jgi:hypothetical protein